MKANKFILRGRETHISKKEIEHAAMRNIAGRGKSYYALVGERKIPVKNLIYEVLQEKGYDFTLLDFTTQDAVRILRKLGVEIVEKVKMGTANNLLKFAGTISLGGDAVKDERDLYK
ncbi:MAG: hypothetical protein E2O67_02345 [Deltaproteobacteria bacterium]|nr:MAG: hypothetical protein E2O67_02345 [Deltaproteobacteria bacterium]